MDIIDSAAETEQLFLDLALQQQRAAGTLLKFTGHCYNCGDPVEAPSCFCEVGCQEDFEKRQLIYKKTHHRYES
jgi:hypothetical protein